MIVAEPYRREPEWGGFKRFGRENGKTAVWMRESIRVWLLESESSENVVSVILKLRDREVRVFGVWRSVDGPILVAGDFNVKNEAWGGDMTDERGEELMEMAVMYGWELANDRNQGPTFESTNGRSWVDVTWSRELEIGEWKVGDTETLSDHKYVTFRVKGLLDERKKDVWLYDFGSTD